MKGNHCRTAYFYFLEYAVIHMHLYRELTGSAHFNTLRDGNFGNAVLALSDPVQISTEGAGSRACGRVFRNTYVRGEIASTEGFLAIFRENMSRRDVAVME